MFCPECKYEYEEDILFCEDCRVSLVSDLPDDLPEEEIKWVSLPNISGDIFAEMVKEHLDSVFIPCYIKTDFMISAFGVKGSGIPGTKAKIYVPDEYYENALETISDMVDID